MEKNKTVVSTKLSIVSLCLLLILIGVQTLNIFFNVMVPYKLQLFLFYSIFVLLFRFPIFLDFVFGLLALVAVFFSLLFDAVSFSDQFAILAYMFFVYGSARLGVSVFYDFHRERFVSVSKVKKDYH